jgi:hypothetical protein
MPRDKRDVEAALEFKGFRRIEGDHHYFVYWTKSGRKTPCKTKTSHGGGKEINEDLLSHMARQCSLTRPLFFKLLDCPLTRDGYENEL